MTAPPGQMKRFLNIRLSLNSKRRLNKQWEREVTTYMKFIPEKKPLRLRIGSSYSYKQCARNAECRYNSGKLCGKFCGRQKPALQNAYCLFKRLFQRLLLIKTRSSTSSEQHISLSIRQLHRMDRRRSAWIDPPLHQSTALAYQVLGRYSIWRR